MKNDYIDQCQEKCRREVDRNPEDSEVFLPLIGTWTFSKELKEEAQRCNSFCTEYYERCAAIRSSSNNSSATSPEIDACAKAENSWKNYLYFLRNRPTTFSFPSTEPAERMTSNIRRESNKEATKKELEKKLQRITGRPQEEEPKNIEEQSVEEYLMNRIRK
uniref:Uncharacterized protein n=1 Tax=Paramoeba aestuarina TaxID=180227 RepID=A0A7S4JGX1_9EUKA|mmetsp:Transcript_10316/g.15511  ORF Transcript_10316/g.15511 Transcript_10316/m.15511 type:complete len:162 (+) Transcript_10316:59-544(+)